MLTHPTLDKLHRLRLPGMARAFSAQLEQHDSAALSFEERLGLLVDEEATVRDDVRLKARLRTAALRQSACVEDIDHRQSPRTR